MGHRKYVAGFLLLFIVGAAEASVFRDAISTLEFSALADTFNEEKVDRITQGHGEALPPEDRRAAAVLITLGAIEAVDLDDKDAVALKLASYLSVATSNHVALMGRIGDVSLHHQMADIGAYEQLLGDSTFLDALGKELSEGVITGYDLRHRGVYDQFSGEHTFIYSQSSLLHMRQLVTLLHSEGLEGWLYITPKVSAFLYREDWGPASDAVKTLPGGVRVLQGREFAAMFQFDSPQGRERFHEIVLQYAKKDTKDEAGLIANAWWQPFYYSSKPLEGFETISLVVLTSDAHEATLTVTHEKTASVVAALGDYPFEMRVEKVWVNPAFFRFLNGDYK